MKTGLTTGGITTGGFTTGGTAGAAIDLIRKSGGEVVAAAFVIDLPELSGAAKLKAKGVKVHTLVSFEGH